MPDFTQILQQKGTKIYLDLNGNVGYFDMSNDAFALSALAIAGDEMLYDETSETVISTISDYFSYGTLRVYNAIYADTINIGIAPEALGIFYADNSAPNAINDTYNYSYDENTAEYTLDVLANDVDADGGILQISSVSSSAIAGTLLNIVNDKIVYQRVAGVATTDIFTYSVCDEQGICDTAQVTITLKSLTPIQSINDDQFINLHPNPTSAFIQVDSKYEVIDIEIYDLQGKIVKKSKESLISLEDLQKGIYFAHVLDKNNDSFVIKVILK